MSEKSIEERVAEIKWYHSIDLGNGIITPGMLKPKPEKEEALFQHFRPGMSVLDVGAWNGLNCVLAKRRGASRVMAVDWPCWSGPRWGTKAGFDLMKEVTGLDIEELEIDAETLDVKDVGQFDMVIASGLLYHLPHPFLFLEKIAPITGEVLAIETVIGLYDVDEPAMTFRSPREDGTEPLWTIPNPACLELMCLTAGFRKFERRPTKAKKPRRGVFYAFK